MRLFNNLPPSQVGVPQPSIAPSPFPHGPLGIRALQAPRFIRPSHTMSLELEILN
uniref:Uncharacterized protein n=1 Tax=Oryza rufipogon TaxID=4529 RepID=A0A0E0QHJ0_ORYRU